MGFYSILQHSAARKTGIRREDHFLGAHIAQGWEEAPGSSTPSRHNGTRCREFGFF